LLAVGALHPVASCCRLLPVAEPANRGALAAPPWDILTARTPTAAAATACQRWSSWSWPSRSWLRSSGLGRRRRVVLRAHDRGRGYRRYRRCRGGPACVAVAQLEGKPGPHHAPLLTKVVRAAPPPPTGTASERTTRRIPA
jgi:hypothetical protein